MCRPSALHWSALTLARLDRTRQPSSPTQPVPKFTRDAPEAIHEPGSRLRERAPIEDFEVAGPAIDVAATATT